MIENPDRDCEELDAKGNWGHSFTLPSSSYSSLPTKDRAGCAVCCIVNLTRIYAKTREKDPIDHKTPEEHCWSKNKLSEQTFPTSVDDNPTTSLVIWGTRKKS
ncbi:hypothetical protein llap_5141 [Limosa lapponica baueri]|uniref:Uncharacterized protein n=1 Tax=Limosa lapponica baueri TaxID=1758121 RepID=A0A2I0UEV4_LIMLA|nr:hypothetical protein llap_5141 [Limosa lapponica baueri]